MPLLGIASECFTGRSSIRTRSEASDRLLPCVQLFSEVELILRINDFEWGVETCGVVHGFAFYW